MSIAGNEYHWLVTLGDLKTSYELYNIYIFKKGELCDVFVFSRMLTMTGERESTLK